MKTIDVYGLGNALVDVLVRMDEGRFAELDMEKATMRLVDTQEQARLLQSVGAHDLHMASGGSVANSVYCIGQLGGKAAFSGVVGDDRYGLFYKTEFEGLNLLFSSTPIVNATTGTCLVIVTPDSERTMRTALGVSSEFGLDTIDEDAIAHSRWVFVEGYLLSNPSRPQVWVPKLIELCRKHNTQIALTCSESWVVETQRELIELLLAHATMVFANEAESLTLSGETSVQGALFNLKKRVPGVAITVGEKGALVAFRDIEGHVPAVPTKPVDLTGAGDAFAGAVLYGLSREVSPLEAARAGCYIASKVIAHMGARYPGDVKGLWQESFEV